MALEAVVAVLPVTAEWSTHNGCLTATQKLVPKKVFAFHAKELEELLQWGDFGRITTSLSARLRKMATALDARGGDRGSANDA